MSSQDVQPCEICAKPTTSRCAPCAEAGVDIFLFGKDCQKLIWKAHKPHCGPGKANPFFVEPLSDDELADLRERAHQPVRVYPDDVSTVSVDLARASGKSYQYVYEHIGGSVIDCEYLRHKPSLVNMVRHSQFALVGEWAREHPRTCADILTHFVGVVLGNVCHRDWITRDLTTTSWYTPLHHKLLILASLTTRVVFREGSTWELGTAARFLPAVREGTTRWVHEGMGTGDARLRKALQDVSFEYEEVF
ncbi:hypothetical protein JCM8208_000126 [Rhodotorula glutinis]